MQDKQTRPVVGDVGFPIGAVVAGTVEVLSIIGPLMHRFLGDSSGALGSSTVDCGPLEFGVISSGNARVPWVKNTSAASCTMVMSNDNVPEGVEPPIPSSFVLDPHRVHQFMENEFDTYASGEINLSAPEALDAGRDLGAVSLRNLVFVMGGVALLAGRKLTQDFAFRASRNSTDTGYIVGVERTREGPGLQRVSVMVTDRNRVTFTVEADVPIAAAASDETIWLALPSIADLEPSFDATVTLGVKVNAYEAWLAANRRSTPARKAS